MNQLVTGKFIALKRILTQIIGKFEYLHRVDVFNGSYIDRNTELLFNLYLKLLYDGGMYIRMYDELKRSEGDNPTIGIVLCSDTDDDIARYSVMHGNEQLFASKYKLYLPTKEELKAEIETQKAMFYLQQQDNEEKETE